MSQGGSGGGRVIVPRVNSARGEADSGADARFLPLLPATLFRAERPVRYLALAWLLSLGGSLLLTLLLSLIAPGAEQPVFPGPPALVLFAVIVFAPAVETAVLALMLWPLDRWLGPARAALAAAAAWGVLHSTDTTIWGFVIWWPFLLFSVTILVWRRRIGWIGGWAMATGLHALQNLLPALGLVAFG